MINRKKRISLLLTMALTCGMFMPAYATEIDDTNKKIIDNKNNIERCNELLNYITGEL